LCGDPRIFDDLTKVPQVFRNPGGSPLLKMVGARAEVPVNVESASTTFGVGDQRASSDEQTAAGPCKRRMALRYGIFMVRL
jgi:hypothetical protein